MFEFGTHDCTGICNDEAGSLCCSPLIAPASEIDLVVENFFPFVLLAEALVDGVLGIVQRDTVTQLGEQHLLGFTAQIGDCSVIAIAPLRCLRPLGGGRL
jgi:hypothetical protein